MGKPPYIYSDSENEETNSCSSFGKKRHTFSILKYTTGNIRKRKCEFHSKSEPSDSEYRSRSRSRHRSRSTQRAKYKLPSILKKPKSFIDSSDDEEIEPLKLPIVGKFLVGRVPRPAGAKPGRGGGVAIVVRKNVSILVALNFYARGSYQGSVGQMLMMMLQWPSKPFPLVCCVLDNMCIKAGVSGPELTQDDFESENSRQVTYQPATSATDALRRGQREREGLIQLLENNE